MAAAKKKIQASEVVVGSRTLEINQLNEERFGALEKAVAAE